ncbi:MAG: ABC transporter permease [Solirubrobacteraceae bacterium]|nr:ABC transporter permease [Solirubrobacteraceae bacterium]
MRDLRLLVRQIGYERRSFFRNPAAAGFTLIFPVMFLVIFGLLYGGKTYELSTGTVDAIQFQLAQILVFSVVGTTFVGLVTGLAIRRDNGELKRKRGTPVSAAVILGGVIGNGVLLSLLMSVLVVGLSVILFGADVPLDHLPALILTLVVGALTFCALGCLVAAAVPNGDSASATANLVIFPLYFLSGIFIPDLPSGIESFAGHFPLRPFLLSLASVFDTHASAGPDWGQLAIVAVWGVVAALLAVRFFRWIPRR